MDLHSPYYPRLRRGFEQGIISAYTSIIKHAFDKSLSKENRKTLESLYWKCVEYLDAQIEAILEVVPDDALVVITGDHGEEFSQDYIGHARLYDQTVRVPAIIKNGPNLDSNPIRQIDIAPTIVDHLGLDVPHGWLGQPIPNTELAYMVNYAPDLNLSFVGVRNEERKLIRTIDEAGHTVSTEAYDLISDPEEQDDIYGSAQFDKFSDLLDKFIDSLDEDGLTHSLSQRETDSAVESRLRELGYV